MANTSDNPVVARATDLVLPIVSDLGLDLYDVEFGGGVLRITVDTLPGSPGGVDVDQLSQVTRLVSRELDHVDLIPGHYNLELSSPGLERNLRTPRHFAREIGKPVAIRLRHTAQGERRVSGILVASGPDTCTVREDSGSERVISLGEIDRARTVFVWEAQPKPGQGRAKKGASTRGMAGPGSRAGTSGSTPSPADFQGRDLDDETDDESMEWERDQESAES